MKTLDALEQEIFNLIVERCNIPDAPKTMAPEEPILGEQSTLGLDSLDAVEIVVAVEQRFNIRIGNTDSAQIVLSSLRKLAGFVREKQSEVVGCPGEIPPAALGGS